MSKKVFNLVTDIVGSVELIPVAGWVITDTLFI